MRDIDFFSNFFVVDDPDSKKNFRGRIVSDIGNFGQLLRTDFKVSELTIKHLEGGKEPSQLFWNTVCDPFCVSNDILSILAKNRITGWTSIPVKIEDKNQRIWENFSALTINGRADTVDYLKSDIIFKEMPGGLFPSFKGLYFKPDSWDGSDIFMSRPDEAGKFTTFIYVTKKLVEVFKKLKIRNIRFVDFNAFEISCFTITVGANEGYKNELEDKIRMASA